MDALLRGAVRAVRIIGVVGWISVGAGCAAEATYAPQTYVVQPRDTLYSIAWRHDLDYRDLARWNHIGPDYRIEVGQILILKPRGQRSGASRPAARASSSAGESGAGAARIQEAPSLVRPRPPPLAQSPEPPSLAQPPSLTQPPRVVTQGQPCVSATADASPGAERWQWPTQRRSPPRPVPGGGILLLGELGQPIRAACPGRVVYAGSGIRGYGTLIIIKHGATVLSAYAHTIDLAVHEGQEVAAGQPIARMGTGPHRIAALYFEIRLSGRPVDPLEFLPREEARAGKGPGEGIKF